MTLAFCHSLDFVLFQTLSATCANSWTRAQEKKTRRESAIQCIIFLKNASFSGFLNLIFLLIFANIELEIEKGRVILVNLNTLRKFFMIKDTLLYADNNAIFAFVRP